jgi:putative membrane protein
MRFLLNAIITAVAVWFVTLFDWFHVQVEGGENEWWTRALVFLVIGALIAGLNALVRPLLTFLALPCLILTLGLFSLFISWAILWLASWITGIFPNSHLTLGSFWQTFWAALVLAITTAILQAIIPGAGRNRADAV